MYKIKFPPGAVKDFLTDALQMTGLPNSQYKYHPEGSTIEFTPNQLKSVISYLKEIREFAEQDGDELDQIKDIDAALETIRTSVMGSPNIAQASSHVEKLFKFCAKFEAKAVKLAEDSKAKVRNRGTVVFDAKSPSVKDNKDHFPINDEAQARNALARVNQFSSVPSWYKGDLKSLINAVYRKVKEKYPSIKVDNDKKKPGKG